MKRISISDKAFQFLTDISEGGGFYGPTLSDTIDEFCREWLARDGKTGEGLDPWADTMIAGEKIEKGKAVYRGDDGKAYHG